MSERPLMIDLFAGLGGWAEGGLAEGYDVIGFDIERHEYGDHRYPGQLVIQDVRTLHGSQFRDAALIVASPPCQAYSYRAMPWKRAKALPPPDNTLFETCFRIQREACEAAGRHIPLIVENVRGAQKWVGRARWSYGSFFLWGDVPALMPITLKGVKGKPYETGNKNNGGSWFAIAHNTTSGKGQNPDGRKGAGPKWDSSTKSDAHGMKRWTNPDEGIKNGGGGAQGWFGSYAEQKANGTISPGRMHGKNHPKRKAASAMIAKIPLPLSRYIAATFSVPSPAPSFTVPARQLTRHSPGLSIPVSPGSGLTPGGTRPALNPQAPPGPREPGYAFPRNEAR